MKKIILTVLLFLVGCGGKVDSTVCTIQYDEVNKIDRSILLEHNANKIIRVQSVDKIYFDEVFTKEVFADLSETLETKFADVVALTYEIEEEEDGVVIKSEISDYTKATSLELSFVGISLENTEYAPGLSETILINEANGYVCVNQ